MERINFTPGLPNQALFFRTEGERCSFTGEISELRIGMPGLNSKLTVVNTRNNNFIVFQCVDVDMDGSREDIYGWKFRAIEGHTKPCDLLIIND